MNKIVLLLFFLVFSGCLSSKYGPLMEYCKKNQGIPGNQIYEHNNGSQEIDCTINGELFRVSYYEGDLNKYQPIKPLRQVVKEGINIGPSGPTNH